MEVSTHTTSPISPSAQLHSGFRAESCSRKPQVSHERCISDTFHTYKAIAQGYLLFRQKGGCYPAELASGNINANSFYTQNSGKHSPFHLERSAISLKCRADRARECICRRNITKTWLLLIIAQVFCVLARANCVQRRCRGPGDAEEMSSEEPNQQKFQPQRGSRREH